MSSVLEAAPEADRAASDEPHASRGSTRRLRLAYVVNQYPQPSQSFIRREIRELEALGHTVERFTVRRWPGNLPDPHDREEAARSTALLESGLRGLLVAVVGVFARSPRRFFSALAEAWRLGRRSDRGLLVHAAYFVEACRLLVELRARGVEHLHAHFGTNSTTVALLCRALGGPSYSFTVHGPEEFDKPEFLHLGRKIEQAAFVAAISEFGRSQLCRLVPYACWDKIKIVRCGVDGAFHDVPPSPPPAAPRLTCVARLHEQKGLPILIDAAARLRREGLRFQVTIVGDGPLRGALEQRIAESDLAGTVELLGWKNGAEVRAAMLGSRALVLPSFAEGLPVVIMEALALHRPVVSTYVAGIPELVTDDVCGRLVPAGAVEPLAEAMRDVLEAPLERLSAWGAEGARRVALRHRAKSEAARLAQWFDAAANESCATSSTTIPHR